MTSIFSFSLDRCFGGFQIKFTCSPKTSVASNILFGRTKETRIFHFPCGPLKQNVILHLEGMYDTENLQLPMTTKKGSLKISKFLIVFDEGLH